MTFHQNFSFSNQEYENVTTSANNLVLWQKLRISKGKNPQNLPKDGYMNNSWEFTLFSWQESVKWYIVLNLFLFFPIFVKKFHNKVIIYNTRKRIYLRYKTIFCSKVALDVQLMSFFIWRKNNVLFMRYLHFCVFVKSTDLKICDVVTGIAT